MARYRAEGDVPDELVEFCRANNGKNTVDEQVDLQARDTHYFKRDTFWEGVTASTFSTAIVGLFALIASLASGLIVSEAATNAAFSLGAAFAFIVIALLWKPVHRYLKRGARYNWKQFRSNVVAAFDDDRTRDLHESSSVSIGTLLVALILAIASLLVVSWIL